MKCTTALLIPVALMGTVHAAVVPPSVATAALDPAGTITVEPADTATITSDSPTTLLRGDHATEVDTKTSPRFRLSNGWKINAFENSQAMVIKEKQCWQLDLDKLPEGEELPTLETVSFQPKKDHRILEIFDDDYCTGDVVTFGRGDHQPVTGVDGNKLRPHSWAVVKN